MTVEIKQPDNINEVMGELRKLTEQVTTKGKESSEYKEKMDKLSIAFENAEKNNTALVAKMAQEEVAKKELAEKLDQLETKFMRPSGVVNPDVKSAAYNEFMEALTTPDKILASDKLHKASAACRAEHMMLATEAQKKYLRTDNNIEGGFMCPPQFDEQIQKKMIEISPMRSLCRVSTIAMKSLNIIVRNTLATAIWEGEAEDANANNSKYGNLEIVANRLTAEHDITYEMLNNGYYDISAEITSDVALQYTRSEGEAFLIGDGVKRPKGIMSNSLVAARNTTVAADVTFDSIKLLTGDLKQGYNPTFLLNRRTVAYLSTLKDGIGQYLWQEGSTGQGVPSTLAGLPYVRAIDMDDIGANKYPILLGAFAEGYRIVDRFGMYMIRDEYTAAGKHIIKLFFHKYTGGDVVLAEAFKKLYCHV
jgi:HK97 family phage major capsid protein